MANLGNEWLDEPGVVRPLLRLAWPVLAEQLLAMLVGLSDTVLTGYFLEERHLAAINLMAYLLWLVYAIFGVVAIGSAALVARYVGARKPAAAQRVIQQSLIIGMLFAVAGAAFGLAFAEPLVAALRLKGPSAESAARYLYYIMPVMPMVMINAVGISCLRGAGAMVQGLLVMAVVNLVNIAVSWAFCLGLGPLPRWGWDGIAFGTACGYTVGGLAVAGILWRGVHGLRLNVRGFRPNFRLMRRVLRVGIPGGLDTLSVVGSHLWFLSVINMLGDRAAAAHGIAIRVESLAFIPAAAFQVAAATMAGQYLGAGLKAKAERSVWMACLIGGIFMCLPGLLFYLRPVALASLLLGEHQREIALAAAPLLRTIALAMPPLTLVIVLSGALRGAGDTRWPLAFSLIGLLGIRVPAAHWLALEALRVPLLGAEITGLGLGVVGAWYAMVTDLYVRAVLMVWRVRHGGWKDVRV
ncbi:MAG: MATE family efflux transporter [Thermogutta sp.]